MEVPPHPVIYFDGVCNLCNAFVDFLIRRDHARRLRYASRQGASFAAVEARHPELREVDSLVAVTGEGEGEGALGRSDAALFALGQLPGPWRYAATLRLVPRFIRDAVYDWIARNRYALFGKRETCRLPSAEERGLFLD